MKISFKLAAAAVLLAATVSATGCSNASKQDHIAEHSASTSSSAEETTVYRSLDDFEGKNLGIQPGTNFGELLGARYENICIKNYVTNSDITDALEKGRIDGFPCDELVALQLLAENENLMIIDDYIDRSEFGYCFPKTDTGAALRDEFNDYINELKAANELEAIKLKWTGIDEDLKVVKEPASLPDINGTLVMVTEGDYEPFSYFKDGKLVGIDIDIAVGFCESKGYKLDIEAENFSSIIPDVAESKFDFGGAGITITDERKESVYFSEPNYSGGIVMVTKK